MKDTILKMLMVSLALATVELTVVGVQAAPVLNENEAINSASQIYPDSVNANLYYFTPQYMGLCNGEDGKVQFSYAEFRPAGFLKQKRGLMVATLCTKEHEAEMNAAIAAVRGKNPKAQFVGLPFTNSEVMFSDEVFQMLIEKSACNHIAGVVGQEESCSAIFSPKGKEVFKKTLRSGLSIVLQFKYTVDGVIRTPAAVQPKTSTFEIAAKISKSDFNGQLESYLNGSPKLNLAEALADLNRTEPPK